MFGLRPSECSTKLWGNHGLIVIPIDLLLILVSLVTIPLSIVSGVQQAPYKRYHDGLGGYGLNIAFDVLNPFLTITTSSITLWLFTRHSLSPTVIIVTSVLLLAWWTAGGILIWCFEAFMDEDYSSPIYKIGCVKLTLAILHVLLYTTYIGFAARSIDLRRKQSRYRERPETSEVSSA